MELHREFDNIATGELFRGETDGGLTPTLLSILYEDVLDSTYLPPGPFTPEMHEWWAYQSFQLDYDEEHDTIGGFHNDYVAFESTPISPLISHAQLSSQRIPLNRNVGTMAVEPRENVERNDDNENNELSESVERSEGNGRRNIGFCKSKERS